MEPAGDVIEGPANGLAPLIAVFGSLPVSPALRSEVGHGALVGPLHLGRGRLAAVPQRGPEGERVGDRVSEVSKGPRPPVETGMNPRHRGFPVALLRSRSRLHDPAPAVASQRPDTRPRSAGPPGFSSCTSPRRVCPLEPGRRVAWVRGVSDEQFRPTRDAGMRARRVRFLFPAGHPGVEGTSLALCWR